MEEPNCQTARIIRTQIAVLVLPSQAKLVSIPITASSTLMIFFESHQVSYEKLDHFLASRTPAGQTAKIEYRRQTFPCLAWTMEHLLNKIRRYGIIYFLNGLKPVPTCNYKNLMAEIEQLTTLLTAASKDERQEHLTTLKAILGDISSPDFFKQLASSMMIKLATGSNTLSHIEAAQFLMELNLESDPEVIRSMLYDKIQEIVSQSNAGSRRYSPFIEKVMQYVEEHLSNPNLTLKWISENHLYMNVDYVSKRFIKETEQKFSNYLTGLRIQKAKVLLAEGHTEQIQWVAEQVGCGNNPQYFSQIFKKNTGLTPSAYAKKINGGM